MFRQITLVAFAVVVFAASIFAQSDKPTRQQPQDPRLAVIEKMNAEVARLGLRVEGEYNIQSVGNGLAVVVQTVSKDAKIASKLINQSGRARIAYLELRDPGDLPDGFYFIQSSPELARLMTTKLGTNSGVVVDQKVTLVSTDGRTTRELPGVVMIYQLPSPLFRHYWTRIIINGTGFWVDGPE